VEIFFAGLLIGVNAFVFAFSAAVNFESNPSSLAFNPTVPCDAGAAIPSVG
jgi:hypothetical protein